MPHKRATRHGSSSARLAASGQCDSQREGADSETGPASMDLIPGYQGYLDQYRPPGYDGNGGASGPPPLVYPEEAGERRRAVSGDRMVILPRRPSEEPDYVIPSSAMQQMLQERDRSRRQQEWEAGVNVSGPPPRVPHLGYPNCHEPYPDQGRLAQETEKLSSQEKEKRKIHAASEYYRKMREETAALRQSESFMSPLGSQHSPGALSLGSPGIPSPQNSTPQSSPLMAGLVSPTGGPSGSRQGRARKTSEPPQRMAGKNSILLAITLIIPPSLADTSSL